MSESEIDQGHERKVIRTTCLTKNRLLLVHWMLGINPLRGDDKGREGVDERKDMRNGRTSRYGY